VGYQVRYSSAVAEARAAIGDQPIGLALGTYLGGLPGSPWWRLQARSGGQVVEQATHVVDLMRFVVGEVDWVHAQAATRLLADVPNLDIADVSLACLRFDSGVIGSLTNTCALRGVPDEHWDHGLTLIARDLSVRMWLGTARIARPGEVRHLSDDGSASYALDAAFIDAVATGDRSGIRSTYADGVASLRVTLAIEESVRSGQAVRPPDLG
jgi:predicted dehydrogenase